MGKLVAQGLQMFMPLLEEFKVRETALLQAMCTAEENGTLPKFFARLRNLLTKTRARGFQRVLAGEPPAGVEPMTM